MGKATEKLQKLLPRTWTPNQVVAHNVTRARLLRGWTQEQAADELAPYLGARLSHASFSAIERSIASTRVKQFSADDLVALSRAFGVPLGWWFIPPEEGALHTPDHDHYGIAFTELVDVVLGTSETLPAWAEALNRWEAETPAQHTGMPSVTARTAELAELRARSLVRERFGDLDNARDVLRGLADLLDQLDHQTGDAAPRGDDVAVAQPGQVPMTPPGP